ncbi:MAG TPA: tail fiber protein [Methylocystis sp.]|nr:tail fiber protein [Methylocystis sp.]
MSDPFVAQVALFPYNFAPRGWAFCRGQILPLSQNTALFSLLGTTYGGDGKSNFALPNLQAATPIHPGQGPGLSSFALGDTGGESRVTLRQSEAPSHSHTMSATSTTGTTTTANNNLLALGLVPGGKTSPSAIAAIYSTNTGNATTGLQPNSVSQAGGGQPHNNLQPYLGLSFCIALQGVYPPRS